MRSWPEGKIAFIAKTITDLGKAIFVAGLVSQFFEKFPWGWRMTISIMSLVLLVGGIVLYPEGSEE
ncbi:hypothetical protein HYZ80_03475 [Candidatus Parcubacteria bacterium]|nr:hypothetical protein [Candidatus Parcubacteria bacterium]